jgi:hypothetical protein
MMQRDRKEEGSGNPANPALWAGLGERGQNGQRNTFARLRLDYSTLNARMRPQFVLGWTPNPGTAFYVGYNDDLNFRGYNPFTRVYEPGLHGNGRTFFIKLSYLFKRSF